MPGPVSDEDEMFLSSDPVIFTGGLLRVCADLISRQGEEILAAEETLTPARCVSILMAIAAAGEISIADLARTHGFSHQLTSQRLAVLGEKGLIESVTAPDDARKTMLRLSEKGQQDLVSVSRACEIGRHALLACFEEAGFSDPAALVRLARALRRQPLRERTA